MLAADAAVLVRSRRRITALAAWPVAAFFLGLLLDPGFGTFRLWGHALFFHAPAVLGGLALRERRLRLLAIPAVFLVALYVDAYHIEPYRLQITRRTQPGPHPLRVAIVADLQMEELGDHERAALLAVTAEHPDLILLAGDYVQVDDPAALRRELNAFLKKIKFSAPRGVYAVAGNTDDPGWEEIFEGLPVTILSNRTIEPDAQLAVTGLDTAASADPVDGHRLVPERPGRLHLVVGHYAEYAMGLADRTDLTLLAAGHTHGGQVKLPWIGPLMTLSNAPRAWSEGAHRVGGAVLHVSRGIGMERLDAPRLRFLCPPEIVIVNLSP